MTNTNTLTDVSVRRNWSAVYVRLSAGSEISDGPVDLFVGGGFDGA